MTKAERFRLYLKISNSIKPVFENKHKIQMCVWSENGSLTEFLFGECLSKRYLLFLVYTIWIEYACFTQSLLLAWYGLRTGLLLFFFSGDKIKWSGGREGYYTSLSVEGWNVQVNCAICNLHLQLCSVSYISHSVIFLSL